MPLADSVKALKSKLSGEIYGAGYRKFSKSTDELITFSKGTFKYCLRLLALGVEIKEPGHLLQAGVGVVAPVAGGLLVI
jgi:hypothetical protein